MRSSLRLGTAAVVDAAAVVLLRPNWSAVATGAGDPQAWVGRDGADAVVGALAGAGLWLVAVWLGVGLAAAVAASLPGTAGAVGQCLARRTLPAVARRSLAVALGLGVLAAPAAGLAGAAPVPAAGRAATATVTAHVVAPMWPTSSAAPGPTAVRTTAAVPAPTWPTGHTESAPPQPRTAQSRGSAAPAGSPTAGVVEVQPGDSLWLIAARRVGGTPDATRIAAAWPPWYAANRTQIGPDPGLIRPGQRLQPPHTGGSR